MGELANEKKVGSNTSFKMLLPVYQTTWCHSPEGSNTGGHNRFLYLFLLRSAVKSKFY